MEKEKRPGATKLRRSCEICRSSKARCLPSGDGDEVKCQKCLKDGKECIFLEPKPRPKRARNSRARVAEMEEKLEGLLSLLAAQTGAGAAAKFPGDTPSNSNSNSTPTMSASPPSEIVPEQVDLPFFDTGTDISTGKWTGIGCNNSFINNFFPSTTSQTQTQTPPIEVFNNINTQYDVLDSAAQFDKLQDVISKGIVTYYQAEEALSRFKKHCSSFLFVVVPEDMSVGTLRKQHSFLLLAILCYGTSPDHKLQEKLEREMREVLSKRLIVNGERSLDLLEGLLVYIAWYHFYFNPKNQQLYQLCQMATSLTADLGIDKPARRVGFGKDLTIGASTHISAFLPQAELDDAEAKRAYLGCYYISSAVCHGLRKPTNLKYSSYMEECAQSLAHQGHAGHDHLLPYFIALQKICEEVSDAFDYSAKFDLPPIDALRIGVLSKSFEQQLDQIEAAFTPKAWDSVQLTMQLYFTRIHIYEVGFHAAALPQEALLSPQLKSRSWYYSTQRSETLIRCLQASKDYIDHFLILPAESLSTGLCTLPDIFGIVYAILVLGTFAVRVDTPTLSASHLREMTNYAQYLNALIIKTSSPIPMTGRSGTNDYLFHLHTLLQQTRVWYAQISADPSVVETVPFPDMARPGFSFMDIIATVVARCVDFAGSLDGNGAAMMEELQWTDLWSGWSESLEGKTVSLGSMGPFQG